ncbi:MAG: hypothetical protein DYH15_09640, partial [Nitrosomonas sp. PRO4]|nr:hypothetical protein [Nitrosomonas sp. PRO4]
MAQTSVKQFANELGLLPTVLLEQLNAAGVRKLLVEDNLTEQDKTQLLDYLRKTHGSTESKTKVTLTRRQTSEIRQSDSAGRARTIQVEVRKKRILTKPIAGELDSAPTVDQPIKKTSPQAAKESVIDAEQLALRNEEARKQAELIARQTEEVRQKRARKKSDDIDNTKNIAQFDTSVKESKDLIPPTSQIAVESEQPIEIQPQPVSTEGTLHKTAEKSEDKPDKKKKQQTKQQGAWQEESAKKRSVKTRGDFSSMQGWRTRREKHSKPAHPEEQNIHGFSAPTEPIVREIMVPETISVSALAQKMSVKAADVIKVLMKMGSMVTILDNLIADGRIRPVIAVFVDPRNPDSPTINRRESQYITNSKFGAFLAEELVPIIDTEYKTDARPEARVILGTSLGGLNSAYLGLNHSDIFGLLAIQSPALWVATRVVDGYEKSDRLPLRIFMSQGTIWDDVENTRRLRDIFEAKGYPMLFIET